MSWGWAVAGTVLAMAACMVVMLSRRRGWWWGGGNSGAQGVSRLGADVGDFGPGADLAGEGADLRAVKAQVAQGAVVEGAQGPQRRPVPALATPGVDQGGDRAADRACGQAGQGAGARRGRKAQGVKRLHGGSCWRGPHCAKGRVAWAFHARTRGTDPSKEGAGGGRRGPAGRQPPGRSAAMRPA